MTQSRTDVSSPAPAWKTYRYNTAPSDLSPFRAFKFIIQKTTFCFIILFFRKLPTKEMLEPFALFAYAQACCRPQFGRRPNAKPTRLL